MNGAGDMIQHVHFTCMVLAKTHDPMTGISEFAMINDLPVLVTEAPDLSCVVISVDVMTVQLLEPAAVVRQPVGYRRRFRVRMLDGWWQYGSRPARPFGIGGLQPLPLQPTP